MHVECLCEYLQVSGDLGEGLFTDILTSGRSNDSLRFTTRPTQRRILKLKSIELDTPCGEAFVAKRIFIPQLLCEGTEENNGKRPSE